MIVNFGIRMALALLPTPDPAPPVVLIPSAIVIIDGQQEWDGRYAESVDPQTGLIFRHGVNDLPQEGDDPEYHARLNADLCTIKFWQCEGYVP